MASILEFAERVNRGLDRWIFTVILGSMAIGAIFNGTLAPLKWAVPVAFGFMTFSTSLGCSWRDFVRAVKSPLPLLVALSLLHIIHPVAAKGIGSLLYGSQSHVAMALILGAAAPVGVTSVIWAGIAGGDIPVALTIVTVDTLLSPLMVPATVLLFSGKAVNFDVSAMMIGLLQMIVVPTLVGVTLNDLTRGQAGRIVKPYANPFAKIALGFVVAVNVAAAWSYIAGVGVLFFRILGGIGLMAVFGYASSYFAGVLLGFDKQMRITMTFSAGMRNISAGAVIAMTYFPPFVAVPVVLSMLFQQPLATVTEKLIRRYDRHEIHRSQAA